MSGVSIQAYWFSNFFVDFMKFLFPTVTYCILMLYAFNVATFTDEADVFLCVILIFLFYGLSVILFSYAFGFVFDTYGNA